MNNNSITIKLNLRLVCILLLVIITGMLALWRPWQHTASAVTRKITISGNATVEATPDEFVFYPSYERTGTDIKSMKNDLDTFGTKLLADVEKLGVAEKDIKLDSNEYNNFYYYGSSNSQQTLTLQVTITVQSKTLAQKVQDYLAGTDAKGQLTAQSLFSGAKQKQLESTARLQAIADARQKAEQTATNVGAKLGKVIEVNDQSPGSRILPLLSSGANTDTSASLPVTPGTDKVTSNVQVVFELK